MFLACGLQLEKIGKVSNIPYMKALLSRVWSMAFLVEDLFLRLHRWRPPNHLRRPLLPRDIDLTTGAVEGDLPSEIHAGDWDKQNGQCGWHEDGGVRSWLNRLGLGWYVPVFEIHEVDDEVLPFLTLEDLKDVGDQCGGAKKEVKKEDVPCHPEAEEGLLPCVCQERC